MVGRKPYFGLFLTKHWVEFNNILHEASIPRGDVHILKVLQLHVTLQSYGPFTYKLWCQCADLGVFIIFSDSSSSDLLYVGVG